MPSFYRQVETLGAQLKQRSWYLSVAESCTGGALAEALTSVPGSSSWFDSGIVSYSEHSKMKLLGVPVDLIQLHGAVSSEVAMAMAAGLLTRSQSQLSLSITGLAGPDVGAERYPVGTVYFGMTEALKAAEFRLMHFTGNREEIRQQAVCFALEWLIEETKL